MRYLYQNPKGLNIHIATQGYDLERYPQADATYEHPHKGVGVLWVPAGPMHDYYCLLGRYKCSDESETRVDFWRIHRSNILPLFKHRQILLAMPFVIDRILSREE